MAGDVLYIGIDLGTFRSVMVSSDSHEEEELTVIGTPKDPIARNSDGTETGQVVQVGEGINIQGGYLFKNNWCSFIFN